MGIVVGDCDCGKISKECNEDDEINMDGFVQDDYGESQVDFEVKIKSDMVLDIGFYVLEDLMRGFDSQDNSVQIRCKEDNISGSLSCFGGVFDCDIIISFFQ